MTTAADLAASLPWLRVPDRRDEAGRPWPGWIPEEAPGGLGHPVLWIDEAALDLYGRGDAEPAVTVRHSRDIGVVGWNAVTWIGALIRFERYPGLEGPAIYRVVTRSHSSANRWRPYYVAIWPD